MRTGSCARHQTAALCDGAPTKSARMAMVQLAVTADKELNIKEAEVRSHHVWWHWQRIRARTRLPTPSVLRTLLRWKDCPVDQCDSELGHTIGVARLLRHCDADDLLSPWARLRLTRRRLATSI